MENKNTCQVCGNGEYCGACGTKSNYMLNNVLRWILAIVVISWVFCAGMMFGELKARVDFSSPYGSGNHMFLRGAPAMGWTSVSSAGTAGENVTFTASSAMPATAIKAIKSGTVELIEN